MLMVPPSVAVVRVEERCPPRQDTDAWGRRSNGPQAINPRMYALPIPPPPSKHLSFPRSLSVFCWYLLPSLQAAPPARITFSPRSLFPVPARTPLFRPSFSLVPLSSAAPHFPRSPPDFSPRVCVCVRLVRSFVLFCYCSHRQMSPRLPRLSEGSTTQASRRISFTPCRETRLSARFGGFYLFRGEKNTTYIKNGVWELMFRF